MAAKRYGLSDRQWARTALLLTGNVTVPGDLT